MKTITLQGDEVQMTNLAFVMSGTDNKLPKIVETRVYLVNVGLTSELETNEDYLIDDELFMQEAERQGTVMTLNKFVQEFNGNGDLTTSISSTTDYIRIINVEV